MNDILSWSNKVKVTYIKRIRVTSQPPLFDLTKTLTMKKFTFFECKYNSGIRTMQAFA